jgi:hypothetical protein
MLQLPQCFPSSLSLSLYLVQSGPLIHLEWLLWRAQEHGPTI